MIAIGKKKNLIYPILMILLSLINQIILIILSYITDFGDYDLIQSYVMFISEFITGLFLYKRNLNFLNKKKRENNSPKKDVQLIDKYEYRNIKKIDSGFKIMFLIISISFFDFYDYILAYTWIDDIEADYDLSVRERSQSVLALYSGILCYFLFNIPIYRHQKFSLIIIFICLIIILITDFFYIYDSDFIQLVFLSCIELFFHSTVDIIEKYLFEFNYINPFQLLMFEGAFGFLFTFIYSFIRNPFTISLSLDRKSFLFISYMFAYIFISGFSNSYRLLTNKLFSPAGLSLVYYFLTPIKLIYNYFSTPDKERLNIYYFGINVFISFIISFCGCIYNELLVLLFCNLDQDTYYAISLRSTNEGNMMMNRLSTIEDLDLNSI